MLTQKRLKELLHYDPVTGLFTWIARSGHSVIGHQAGCLKPNGYRVIRLDGVLYRANRLAFLYMIGEMPKVIVDHKNTIRSDDSWINLREASYQQNAQNSSPRKSQTGFRGVMSKGEKFVAGITHNRKRMYIGTFDSAEEASEAYEKKREELHGSFKYLGG